MGDRIKEQSIWRWKDHRVPGHFKVIMATDYYVLFICIAYRLTDDTNAVHAESIIDWRRKMEEVLK